VTEVRGTYRASRLSGKDVGEASNVCTNQQILESHWLWLDSRDDPVISTGGLLCPTALLCHFQPKCNQDSQDL